MDELAKHGVPQPKKRALEWGGGQEMSELESTMWRANKHPENSTQGGVLEVLGGTPDWETVRRWHRFGLTQYPRFTQKVVDPPLPVGPPVWVDDPSFSLDRHLFRVSLGGSGSMADLLTEAQRWALEQLNPRRPPWRGVFIEGLDGGRSAYFLVVHHCLMDGHGSVQLLGDLHSRDKALADSVMDEDAHRGEVSGWQVAAGQVLGRVRSSPGVVTKVLSAAASAVRDPGGSGQFASSVVRVMAPPPASKSPLLSEGSRTDWRYGTLSCRLSDLRAAGKAVGGTINDAYVCSILGGLRIYHEDMGLNLGDVTINMPVSVRREGDSKGGNKFAAAFITAPSSILDAEERMVELRKVVTKVSSEPALDFFSVVLPVLNRAPARLLTPLFTGMQNRTDVTISNVPGMRKQAKFLGEPVEGIYYFGPLPGSPVMVVLYTMGDHAFIGVNCDGEIFDVERLISAFQRGLDEILKLPERVVPVED